MFTQTNIRLCIQYTILNLLNFQTIQIWFNLSNFLSRLNCQTIQPCIQYTNIRSRTYVRVSRCNDDCKWLRCCNLQRLRKSCIKQLRRSCICAPQKSCDCIWSGEELRFILLHRAPGAKELRFVHARAKFDKKIQVFSKKATKI